jgi:hypothetical protein
MEHIESMKLDGNTLVLVTKTKVCKLPVTVEDKPVEKEPETDELKNLMDEVGDNLSKLVNKSGEILNEKRKEVLKGLRDWIDKELK